MGRSYQADSFIPAFHYLTVGAEKELCFSTLGFPNETMKRMNGMVFKILHNLELVRWISKGILCQA